MLIRPRTVRLSTISNYHEVLASSQYSRHSTFQFPMSPKAISVVPAAKQGVMRSNTAFRQRAAPPLTFRLKHAHRGVAREAHQESAFAHHPESLQPFCHGSPSMEPVSLDLCPGDTKTGNTKPGSTVGYTALYQLSWITHPWIYPTTSSCFA